MLNKIFLLLLLGLTFASPFLQAQQLEIDPTFWAVNGAVNTIIREGNTLYLGGELPILDPILVRERSQIKLMVS